MSSATGKLVDTGPVFPGEIPPGKSSFSCPENHEERPDGASEPSNAPKYPPSEAMVGQMDPWGAAKRRASKGGHDGAD